MRLEETQRLLQRLITAPEGAAAVLAETEAATLPIKPSATLTAIERVEIYAQMYFYRIRDALKEDFPAVLACIGEERFAALIKDYLTATPPTHFSLRYAGAQLPLHLTDHGGALVEQWPFLPDLARFEWMLTDLYDAPDAPALHAEDLQSLPTTAWPKLVLRTIPAFRCETFAWPVFLMRDSLLSPEPLAPSAPEATRLAIWRPQYDPVYRSITLLEATLLPQLTPGITFAALCDAIVHAGEGADPVATAGQCLQQWLADQCLTKTV